jgi:hypothetical protein
MLSCSWARLIRPEQRRYRSFRALLPPKSRTRETIVTRSSEPLLSWGSAPLRFFSLLTLPTLSSQLLFCALNPSNEGCVRHSRVFLSEDRRQLEKSANPSDVSGLLSRSKLFDTLNNAGLSFSPSGCSSITGQTNPLFALSSLSTRRQLGLLCRL